jgi:3D (Asp-Asp-Asp) domain-containing protein
LEKPISTAGERKFTKCFVKPHIYSSFAQSNRRSPIVNRLWIAIAVCILGCIAVAAYVKANRRPILLSSTVTEPVSGRVGLAPPVTPKSVEPNRPAAGGAPSQLASLVPHKAAMTPKSEPKHEPAVKWRTVKMRVTGYCPCSKCCGPYSDGITASGHKVRPGDVFVAADRRYPFGTEMIIPGYNNGQPVKVLDRGGAIRGNKLDAFFYTHQQALEWGVKYLKVKVRVR